MTLGHINDDGVIDGSDIIVVSRAFGTSGDPTKNVNVTNWPTSTPVTVGYYQAVPPTLQSAWYKTSGYGQLHILVYTIGLTTTTEVLRFSVHERLWNEAHIGYYFTRAYTCDFDIYTQYTGITIPVPSEEFCFTVSAVSRDGYFSLSFYLTWR